MWSILKCNYNLHNETKCIYFIYDEYYSIQYGLEVKDYISVNRPMIQWSANDNIINSYIIKSHQRPSVWYN